MWTVILQEKYKEEKRKQGLDPWKAWEAKDEKLQSRSGNTNVQRKTK